MLNIKESDWKYLRNLKKILLDRLCNRILDSIQTECAAAKRDPEVHEQYLKVFRYVKELDKIVADCFDSWSRSEVIFNLLFLIKHEVITNEEIEQLSDETKERIKFHLNS